MTRDVLIFYLVLQTEAAPSGRITRTMRSFLVAFILASIVIAPAPASGRQFDLNDAAKAGAEFRRLHSLLVTWRGQLILERYYNGRKASSLANIKSASK